MLKPVQKMSMSDGSISMSSASVSSMDVKESDPIIRKKESADENVSLEMGEQKVERKKWRLGLRLADHTLNLFVYTPLVIFYSASTWDIIYLYIYPTDLRKSFIVTFVVANFILLSAYFLQNKLQSLHDKCPSGQNLNIYYLGRTAIRLLYTYLIAVAYVFQFRTYWDVYNEFTVNVSNRYFIGLSILTLLLYRYVLKYSLSTFARISPFHLLRDQDLSAYFKQAKIKSFNNKIVEKLVSFIYYEMIESMLCVFAWKGLWDLVDTNLDSLVLTFASKSSHKIISLLITMIIGLLMYTFLFVYQSFRAAESINNPIRTTHNKLVVFAHDLFHFAAYFGMICWWRTYWSGYDYFVLESTYKLAIIVFTHLLSFLFLFTTRFATAIYGPVSSSSSRVSRDNFQKIWFRVEIFSNANS